MRDQSHEWSPDQRAAHELLSELRTRIATQPLPYQHGVEARALESLWEIFALARKTMKGHPGCVDFARSTTRMLNVELRPFTAKWHRAYEVGLLKSRDGANEFRADLTKLQDALGSFCLDLQQMAYGRAEPDERTPPVIDDEEIKKCFHPVRFGLVLAGLSMLVYGVALRVDTFITITGKILGVLTVCAVIALMFAGLEWCYRVFFVWQGSHWLLPVAVGLPIAAPVAVRFLPLSNSPTGRKLTLQAALILAGAIVPIESVLVYYEFRIVGSHGFLELWSLVAATLLTGAYSVFGLDINSTGPHKIYRDKLSHTFIQNESGKPVPLLNNLNSSNSAPYHLINAVINLPSSTSDVLRDRRGDFFLFSKLWSGSSAVGYMQTKDWLAKGKPLDLATATAISGAAASPHMGLGSVSSLSALMTLLNIRLGFWIAKPGSGASGAPNFFCLIREMTGIGMSEAEKWLNLSDGGHIENMGVFELLRRRCKFLVCVDGEADPASTFQGQLTLVRHAQIDLGVRIEPRFDDLRPDADSRLSRSHLQLFRVFYPQENARPAEVGLMLYVKLSLTGNEAELLKRYQALHPEFPHQSTLNQFYDEEQFEAYRQLGVHVAEGAFAPALICSNRDPETVADWFRCLAANLLEPAVPTK